MTPQEKELLWLEAIQKARSMVQVKSKNQMLIAELAMAVCEISWGGMHARTNYTIKRFAAEIGLNVKTVSQWIAVRRNAYEKLPTSKARRLSFSKLAHISALAGPNATKSLVLEKFDAVVNIDAFDNKVRRHVTDLRSIAHNFTMRNAAIKCKTETLQEILFYTLTINKHILGEHPNLQPKSHGIAGINIHNQSAAQAMEVSRSSHKVSFVGAESGDVRITPKDRDVAQYLEKFDGKFITPTEIGMKIHGHNRNSASAWACRSLEKLVTLGLAERSAKGTYRWKEEK